MLKMSKLADYGIIIMTSIARDPQQVHSAAELATRTALSMPTVSKVLKTLAREGLVISLRGAKGGYMLPHPPEEISLMEVIDAIEGPIGMTECSSLPGLCTQESTCSVRSNWQRINQIVLSTLERITLADMTQPIEHVANVSAIKFDRLQKPAAISKAGE